MKKSTKTLEYYVLMLEDLDKEINKRKLMLRHARSTKDKDYIKKCKKSLTDAKQYKNLGLTLRDLLKKEKW